MINKELVEFNLDDYTGFYSTRYIPLPDAYEYYRRVKVLEYSYKDPELGLVEEYLYICRSTIEVGIEYVFYHLYDAIYYSYGVDLTAEDSPYI